jgi:hypothetical protein
MRHLVPGPYSFKRRRQNRCRTSVGTANPDYPGNKEDHTSRPQGGSGCHLAVKPPNLRSALITHDDVSRIAWCLLGLNSKLLLRRDADGDWSAVPTNEHNPLNFKRLCNYCRR